MKQTKIKNKRNNLNKQIKWNALIKFFNNLKNCCSVCSQGFQKNEIHDYNK